MSTKKHSGEATRFRQSVAKRKAIDAELAEAREIRRTLPRPGFQRKQRVKAPRVPMLYAFDLETTNIAAGTPEALYLTAYGVDLELQIAIESQEHLGKVIADVLLTSRFYGARFVAWNSNRFDAYFIAASLIGDSRFVLRPYLTKSKTLRGLRVTLAEDGDKRTGKSWEFLDGIAMTGLAGVSLEKFLETFAPKFKKLSGTIDFEGGETFDPTNPRHCAYALRDSEGLWHGINHAQSIMLAQFGEPLGVTMGGACIKIFAAHIPNGISIRAVPRDIEPLIRDYVMRGGYCHLVKQYDGPVWKYDVNQAYAAAMRDAELPCGSVIKCRSAPNLAGGPFIAKVKAHKARNLIPFYCRTESSGRIRTVFANGDIPETWITSIEYRQLLAEGWHLQCIEAYQWAESFNMRDYVDRLERIRTTCEGGPKGAIGTMIKATGNHSYGKTVENLEPIDFLFAKDRPTDFSPFYGNGGDPMEHVWYRIDSTRRHKEHHQPQIGAFITAFVRMQIRKAALIAPRDFLYADTDCVVFKSDVTGKLDIDPGRYGAWKIEVLGEPYSLIAKKVYISGDGKTRAAKGMRVRDLTAEDFDRWANGELPSQSNPQLSSFPAVMHGAEMFTQRRRTGTAVKGRNAAV